MSDALALAALRRGGKKAFEPLNPNAETIATMKAARRGGLVKAGRLNWLLRSLNAGP